MRAKMRDSAVWLVGAGCYFWAARHSNHAKTLCVLPTHRLVRGFLNHWRNRTFLSFEHVYFSAGFNFVLGSNLVVERGGSPFWAWVSRHIVGQYAQFCSCFWNREDCLPLLWTQHLDRELHLWAQKQPNFTPHLPPSLPPSFLPLYMALLTPTPKGSMLCPWDVTFATGKIYAS